MPYLKRGEVIPDRNWKTLNPIPREVFSVLELGDKKDKNCPPYKVWFEQEGYRHVSVDINGANGALAKDLRQPLGLGVFDLVTNFGTTEHVSIQEPVWRNICEACRLLFVSVTPIPFRYPNHGLWYPTPAFYSELARLNGFLVERMDENVRSGGRANLHVRMRRFEMRPFVMPDPDLIIKEAETDKYTERIAALTAA